MFLSDNLINYISKFLNVIELHNFESYLKYLSENSIFKHNSNIKFPKIKHIKKFYSDLSPELFNETFYDSLVKSNAFISGSSVLQAIIGEKWNDFDIDIYQPCTKECCNNEIEFYDEGEGKFSRVTFSPIENYLWKNCVQDKYNYNNYANMLNLGIHIIRKYKFKLSKLCITSIPGKPGTHFQVVEKDLIIQVINVENKANLKTRSAPGTPGPRQSGSGSAGASSDLNKFVIDKFDFTFCMNTFDGKKLYIRDSKSVTKKESKIMVKENEFIAETRCQKYHSRGFKIIGYDLSKPVRCDVDRMTFNAYYKKIIYPKTIIINQDQDSVDKYITGTALKNKNIKLVFE